MYEFKSKEIQNCKTPCNSSVALAASSYFQKKLSFNNFHFISFFTECSTAQPCQGLGPHAHFRDFGSAMLTLFRIATGDNWNGILEVSEITSGRDSDVGIE